MASGSRLTLADLLLPILIMAVVGMMIFPLPLAMLDLLLMFNIALSLSLLVSSIYVEEPERFTVLPTLLLLSTLFRLSLNISTTRQILAQGEAPDIVAAFGHFVVGGNVVVGLVVFLILTVVQFLVIAKGAERVAEVAARFTLDAMPGKQMAIDADVRAGLLSLREARERRRDLHRESKLYGALDGAMKFVKGDAIAGLLITAINIIAGFSIGITQHGLSLGEAAHRYTVFTIGDALASQVPALLVAVASGICVTRVADREGAFFGREVFSQLAREPQAVVATSILLLALAAAPGLPGWPFLFLGLFLLTIAARTRRTQAVADQRAREVEFRPRVYSPVTLVLSGEATKGLQREAILPGKLRDLRLTLFHRSGVLVPDIQFELDPSISGLTSRLLINGATRGEISVVEPVQENLLSNETERMVLRALDKHLVELVDDSHTRLLFDVHQAVAEELINSVVPSVVSVTALTTILRELVRERVSIREFRTILQALAECGLEGERLDRSLTPHLRTGSANQRGTRPDLLEMLGAVRRALSNIITQMVADPSGAVKGFMLDVELDYLLQRVITSAVPLSPDLIDQLSEACRQKLASTDGPAVVFASDTSRAALFRILDSRDLHVSVVTLDEIVSRTPTEVLGVISVLSHSEVAHMEEHTTRELPL